MKNKYSFYLFVVECTVLTSNIISDSAMYILPRWRKYGIKFWLKAWNPDIYEGIIFAFSSIDGLKNYILFIGANDNEKVKLLYSNEDLGKDWLVRVSFYSCFWL